MHRCAHRFVHITGLSHTNPVLERQFIRLPTPKGSAKTSKFVQARQQDNTSVRVEMEAEELGRRRFVCELIESLHHYSLTYSAAYAQGWLVYATLD